MAKKPFHFTERDPKVRCMTCGKPIQKTVIARKKNNPKRCFKDHKRWLTAELMRKNAERKSRGL
jgi:hypothetical protein